MIRHFVNVQRSREEFLYKWGLSIRFKLLDGQMSIKVLQLIYHFDLEVISGVILDVQ